MKLSAILFTVLLLLLFGGIAAFLVAPAVGDVLLTVYVVGAVVLIAVGSAVAWLRERSR